MKRLMILVLMTVLSLNAVEMFPFLIKIGEIEFTETSKAVAVDSEDRIFVAKGLGGIAVYEFNQESGIILLNQIDDGGNAYDITCSLDGRVVFVANGDDGIRVYSFIDNTFSCVKHSATMSSGTSSIVEKDFYSKIDLVGDNRFSVIRHTKWTDTMRPATYEYGTATVYEWSNGDLSVISGECYPRYLYDSHIWPGDISDYIDYDENSSVLACADKGLKINGIQIVSTGGYVSDLHLLSDGTILSANSNAGLKAHRFDQELVLLDAIDDGGSAKRVFESSDGSIYLANGLDGVRSYKLDRTLTCIAHADDGGNAVDIAELSDGTLIVVNEIGLIAYGLFSPGENDDDFELISNYPNPFNPTTIISYQLPILSDVDLMIFDINGHKIKQWSYNNQSSGTYEITWNGTNQSGNPLPSGVYIFSIRAGEFVQSKKMLMLK